MPKASLFILRRPCIDSGEAPCGRPVASPGRMPNYENGGGCPLSACLRAAIEANSLVKTCIYIAEIMWRALRRWRLAVALAAASASI